MNHESVSAEAAQERAATPACSPLGTRANEARLTLGICIALAVLALAAFWSVLGHQFLDYDDQMYITENSQVRAGLTWDNVRWAFTTSLGGNWNPLVWLSHMLDVQVFGLHAGGHHAVNLFLHVASSLLLFMVLQRSTGSRWRSALVAALFAVHPLHVESVAWISERKDVLSGLFFMLTLWAYSRYAEARTQGTGSRPKHFGPGLAYSLALLFFIFGLMSKPMLVTVPFVLLLLDVWPFRRVRLAEPRAGGPTLGRLLLEKLPFLALSAIVSVLTFLLQKTNGAMQLVDSVPRAVRIENIAISYVRYLAKTFWPANLAAFYPFPDAWPSWEVVGAVALLVSISLAAMRYRASRPYFAVGWFWFVGMLVPVIGLVHVGLQAMADRYTYLPLIGIFVAVVWLAHEMGGRFCRGALPLQVVGGSVVLGCAFLSSIQADYWNNTRRLFEHTLAVTSRNAFAEFVVGRDFLGDGRLEEALPHYLEVVRLTPGDADALNDLGYVLAAKGQTAEAVARYRESLAAKPRNPAGVHYNLANALASQDKVDEAIAEYQAALQPGASIAYAHYGLARVLLRKKETEQAKRQYALCIQEATSFPPARLELAQLYMAEGNWEAAVEQLNEYVRLRPPDGEAHLALGTALARSGKTDAACEEYIKALNLGADVLARLLEQAKASAERGELAEAAESCAYALRLNPDRVDARRQLALIYSQGKQLDKAVAELRRILRLQPSAQAHYDLGVALVMQNEQRVAVEQFRAALKLNPNLADALNDLAWVLATDASGEVRDGAEAAKLAERACQLANWREPAYVGTLAAAYAEAGKFHEAETTAQKAVDLATAAGQKDLAARNRELLGLYRAGKPYRNAAAQGAK